MVSHGPAPARDRGGSRSRGTGPRRTTGSVLGHSRLNATPTWRRRASSWPTAGSRFAAGLSAAGLEAIGSGDQTHANVAASAGSPRGAIPSGSLSPLLRRLVEEKRVLTVEEPLSTPPESRRCTASRTATCACTSPHCGPRTSKRVAGGPRWRSGSCSVGGRPSARDVPSAWRHRRSP